MNKEPKPRRTTAQKAREQPVSEMPPESTASFGPASQEPTATVVSTTPAAVPRPSVRIMFPPDGSEATGSSEVGIVAVSVYAESVDPHDEWACIGHIAIKHHHRERYGDSRAGDAK